MEKTKNPSSDVLEKTARINKLRKELADKMIPLFGPYKEIGGSYIFEPSLSKMEEVLGFDKSHISRLLAPPNFERKTKNKVTENNYRSIMRLVDALVRQKKNIEETKEKIDINNIRKIVDEQKKKIKELEEKKINNKQKEININNLRKIVDEQKKKIEELKELKKPIINKEDIDSLGALITLVIIIFLFITYYRNDIIDSVDSFRHINEFNSNKEELIFHNGEIEFRPIIDTSDIYEYTDLLKNDTLVMSKKGLKILKGERDTLKNKERN